QALALFRRHRFAAALRWWSTYEALWANLTILERAAHRLRLQGIRAVGLDDQSVVAAAECLGLAGQATARAQSRSRDAASPSDRARAPPSAPRSRPPAGL